jgi:molybdopterin/thiamine biosynthesis adenylyltransferase
MMAPRVSFLRQLDIFDPQTFSSPCHVIGVGAVGAGVAELLVRIGVPQRHLYDADEVRAHNVPTGAFHPANIGRPKTMALHERFASFTSTAISPHAEMVGESSRFGGVVFVCVDNMDTRRIIWHHCLRLQSSVRLMIEIRLGPQAGQIYTVNPIDLVHIKQWEAASAYATGYNETLACTNRGSAPLLATITGLAVNQLVQWHAQKEYANLIVVGLQGMPLVEKFRWE